MMAPATHSQSDQQNQTALPHELTDTTQFVHVWWQHDERDGRLPGEDTDHSVFVMDFFDGCKYFGFTSGPSSYRVASLTSHSGGLSPNAFVMEHIGEHVPYTVRCVQSGLTKDAARELRDTMVAQAPNTVQRSGNTVQHRNCLAAHNARLRANERRARELTR